MGVKDWFKSDIERLGQPVPSLTKSNREVVTQNQSSSARVTARLPRGAEVIREKIDTKEHARWARAGEIAEIAWKPGDLLLGKFNDQWLGYSDDKPMVLTASARSGKTATVLLPTLYTYPGSAVVLDPKGELAAATAEHRRDVLGQDVHILDPFGATKLPASHFNPLSEIDPVSPVAVDDVDMLTQMLIVAENGADGSHWSNSAENLLRGIILYALTMPEEKRNLVTVRQLLTLTTPELAEMQAKLQASGSKDPAEAVQNALYLEMASHQGKFGGALAGAGNSFLRKNSRERSSIVSTAEVQTKFLDSELLQASLSSSSLKLGQLRDRPTTIYFCLPSGYIEKHFRWLRIIVRLALAALEKRGPWERGKPPVLFLLEEMALLGHMPVLESAAAFFPGFGVKLVCVLQDLGQLQRHYKAGWQTFLGNAGVLQFFANGDKVTLDYISDRLGSLSFVRGSFGAVGSNDDKSKDYVEKERLAYGHELAAAFSRGTGAQILLIEGRPPMAVERLSFADVEAAKAMRPAP